MSLFAGRGRPLAICIAISFVVAIFILRSSPRYPVLDLPFNGFDPPSILHFNADLPSLRPLDRTLIINLPHRRDRRVSMLRVVHKLNASASLLPAFSASTDAVSARLQMAHRTDVGRVGSYLSHYAAWKMVAASDQPLTLIFEDDVDTEHDLSSLLQNILPSDTSTFDIVYLSHHDNPRSRHPISAYTHNESSTLYELHPAIHPIWSSGYLLTPSGAALFLKHLSPNNIVHNVDVDMARLVSNRVLTGLAVHPPLVIQRSRSADNPSEVNDVDPVGKRPPALKDWLEWGWMWYRGTLGEQKLNKPCLDHMDEGALRSINRWLDEKETGVWLQR